MPGTYISRTDVQFAVAVLNWTSDALKTVICFNETIWRGELLKEVVPDLILPSNRPPHVEPHLGLFRHRGMHGELCHWAWLASMSDHIEANSYCESDALSCVPSFNRGIL
jgi:hypothetical protein